MDLLVVGGTGLLGRSLVAAACSAGRSVAATHHASAPDTSVDGVAWHSVDLRAPDEIIGLIDRLRPLAVVNAAYVQQGPDLHAVTAEAPGVVAVAARDVGARLVHVSSDVVFAGDTDEALDESRPVAPVTGYGRAKLTAERLVGTADPSAVIVRTSLLWGPDPDRGGPQLDLVTDPTTVFFTNQVRCPIRVDRLAAACLEIAGRPDISGVLHVAGSDAVDRLRLARLLAPLVDVDPVSLRGEPDTSGTRPNRIVLDTGRARSLLRTPLSGIVADRT